MSRIPAPVRKAASSTPPTASSLPMPGNASRPAQPLSIPTPRGSTSSVDGDEDADDTPLPLTAGIDHIKVCVRIRPMIRDDRDAHEVLAWRWDRQSIAQDKFIGKGNSSPTSKPPENAAVPSYQFDHIFVPDDTNEVIYDAVIRQLVNNCMEGYHGSVFSYGQTSSGKTFTMNGTSKQPGVIPLAVYDLFSLIEDYQDREFLFRATYMEVYNEQVKDLLNPDPTQSGCIKIQHDPKLGTVISGIREQVVANAQQVMALLQGGESHRHVGSTNMNEKSSRAHTVFRMRIESKERFADSSVRVSTLNLIDLAGSENARMTGSTGDRAKEAKFINQSLLTLSTIIQRLSEESSSSKRQHLPYRDSKLTRILQEPLSGNALIAIICTLSPALRCAEESNNTLRFATRAKKVKVAAATVNEDVDDKALLKAYRQEIEQLKAKLAQIATEEVAVAVPSKRADADDEESREKILQMIDDMERFIVKSDLSVLAGIGGGFDSPGKADADQRAPRRLSMESYPATLTDKRHEHNNNNSTVSFELFERRDGALHSRSFKNLVVGVEEGDEKEEGDGEGDGGEEVAPMRRVRSIYSADSTSPVHASSPNEQGFFEGPKLVPSRRSSHSAHDRSALSSPDASAGQHGADRRKSFRDTAHSGEVILMGVAQMLQSLKAQVAKASLGSASAAGSVAPSSPKSNEELESLRLDIRLKDADTKFLEEELAKKERVMEELTDGLREVALTHEQWAADLEEAQLAYEAQAGEVAALRERVAQLEARVREGDAARARVQILESVLRRKDKQLQELTGVVLEEEEEGLRTEEEPEGSAVDEAIGWTDGTVREGG